MEQFPKQFPLSGSDYFQVILDDHHRKHGGPGNLSRLALTLDGDLSAQTVEGVLQNHDYVRWLYTLRLKNPLFGKPYWIASGSTEPVVKSWSGIQVIEIPVVLDPDRGPALQFDLLHADGRTIVLFSWNHILMDARGAEILMMHLGAEVECQYLGDQQLSPLGWKDRVGHILKMKEYILERVQQIPNIAVQAGDPKAQYAYLNIAFSEEETSMMDAYCDAFHIRLGKSAFYLSALLRAFHATVALQDGSANYWIPVPQDQRRKGVYGPVMANQVSTLFFGIHADQFAEMRSSIDLLTQAMVHQMRERLPESNRIMMDSMLYAPFWIYRYLVKSPTKGRLASVFYSDTGNSLEGMTTFLGHPFLEAVHYAPPSSMPGWTCIFMRVRGRQQVVVSYPVGTDADATPIRDFEETLRQELLGQIQ